MSKGLFASHLFEGGGGLGQSHTTAAEDADFSSMVHDLATSPAAPLPSASTSTAPKTGVTATRPVASVSTKGSVAPMPWAPASAVMPSLPSQTSMPTWVPFAIIGGGLLLLAIPIGIVFASERKSPTPNRRRKRRVRRNVVSSGIGGWKIWTGPTAVSDVAHALLSVPNVSHVMAGTEHVYFQWDGPGIGLREEMERVLTAPGMPSIIRAFARRGPHAYQGVQPKLHRNGRRKITPAEAKRMLREQGVDFSRDYHTLPSSQVDKIVEMAKAAGYRKRKDAPGSTARMYFQYLSRVSDLH